MMLRPGTEYIGVVNGSNPTKLVPFVAAFDDTALIELTDGTMRVWRNDALITRAAVATTIAPFSSWTTSHTGTAVVTTTSTSLLFSGMNSGCSALATTPLTIASGDQETEHALRFQITNGPFAFSIGSGAALSDVLTGLILDTGTYSIAFTPGMGTVYVNFAPVQLSSNANTTTQSIPTWAQTVSVVNISIESAGVLVLPTPWGLSQIGAPGITPSTIRYDSSGDIVFVAASGVPQYQINRYSPTSWAVVNYRPIKGPMTVAPTNSSVTLTPSSLAGTPTLTASSSIFTPSDVGTLFRLFSSGQVVGETLSFNGTYTDAIEVTGVSYVSTVDGSGNVHNTATPDRNFSITTTGTWSGNLRLQRSFTSATTGFSDYETFTTNQTGLVITDGLNNEIVWYRLGFDPGDYVSGKVVVGINYSGGGNYGVCHITSLVSGSVANVEVLVPFWSVMPTSDWLKSEWSSSQGYPTCVALHEGRLWWAGADKWWGSVSDDYSNFDYDATGDSAPIDQSIGSGPIANINWLVSIDHLLAGADTSIITAMSDAIESPLTPSNFTLRRSVTNGSYQISAHPVDQRVVYVDQSGRRLYELIYDIRLYNYKPTDLTRLNPDIGLPGFTDMVVQRQPDTRINLIRTDGILVSFIYDTDDDVQAFWRAQTQGAFEAIAVLPGTREDQVYVVVNRVINGVAVRYLEKFARIDECQGAAICKNVDACLVYQGLPASVLSGFTHLIGQTVAIWGQTSTNIIGDLGTAVVSNTGTVTIPDGLEVTNAVAGLPYQAEFISAKLEYAARVGPGLNLVKRIDHIGFSLVATHCQGVRYGSWRPNDQQNVPNGIFTPPLYLDDMPLIEYGTAVGDNFVWPTYDCKMIEFPSEFDSDNRIYLQAASPRPATVLGFSFMIEASG